METEVLIIGTGCAGLYCALQFPEEIKITMITKADVLSSDSFLAQGGMCMLKEEADYESFFEDTMKAGHWENDRESVEIMIRGSREVVSDLVALGARFQREENGELAYTREGAHSQKRIIYHKDVTGKEITGTLLREVKTRKNIEILEHTAMIDLIADQNVCYGAVLQMPDGKIRFCKAKEVVLATGGIGGLYAHSTNYPHLTGDALAAAIKHGIALKDISYVQIHPTTLYAKEERSFLISESVRGEGALLRDKNGNRFTQELLPRDLLTKEIQKQMEKDHTEFVWEDLTPIPEKELQDHFQNILEHCKKLGYDVRKDWIPVVPAQHYFMGGIKVDHESKTSMEHLYAVGETACNGVHGRNRLASNSLLESLVFAKRAALDIWKMLSKADPDFEGQQNRLFESLDENAYDEKKIENIKKENRNLVKKAIDHAGKEEKYVR